MADFDELPTPLRRGFQSGRVGQRNVLPNAISRKHRQLVQEGIDAIVSTRSEASEGDFVDIQEAIDYVNSLGGGTVLIKPGTYKIDYSITLQSKISLVGQGIDTTVIDFQNQTENLNMDTVDSVLIEKMTIKNSNHTSTALSINGCDNVLIQKIKIADSLESGLIVSETTDSTFDNIQSNNNGSFGIAIGSSGASSNLLFSQCFATGNTDAAYRFGVPVSGNTTDITVINCVAENNTDEGFSNSVNSTWLNCRAESNGGNGFDISVGSTNATFIGCISENNTGIGFDLNNSSDCILIGCKSSGNTADDVDFSNTGAVDNIFIGHALTTTIVKSPGDFINSNYKNTWLGGKDSSTITEARVFKMDNNSGGTLSLGDVVIYKADADGESVTTTTTGGDDKVLGVIVSGSDNNRVCSVMVEGKTNALKVDGTTDIAIGDFLSTFTSAGIAQKASSGDMVFAIALEAYTTDDSNGVIDALLITPRKI